MAGSVREVPFNGAIGAEEGMAMCSFTMDDSNLCGAFHKANQEWRRTQGTKHFGITYTGCTPKEWATQFLAARNTWVFAHRVIRCLQNTQRQLKGQRVSVFLDMDPRYAGRRGNKNSIEAKRNGCSGLTTSHRATIDSKLS
eukprot:7584105-Ditylum_brightwellii.AAC.1